MNWQHLIYFHKIVEAGSFSAASRQLYITTSALSKAIQNLEDELEFPLFEKQGRNAVLTKFGKEFDVYVKEAIDVLDKGIQSIHESTDVISGKLEICGVWTMVGGYLPEKIRKFHTMYPKVTYSTKFLLTEQILESVLSGKSELGFCGNFQERSECKMLEYEHLFDEELVLIVPPDHPLGNLGSIEPKDFELFCKDGFISFRDNNCGGVYEAYAKLAKACRDYPRVSMYAHDDHAIIANVSAGMGIALIPFSKWLPLTGVKTIRFTKDVPVRKQYMIWKKGGFLTPVARVFRDMILSNPEEE